MPEHTINWLVDTLARSETLNLNFIITELIDIPITDAELSETALFDAFATHTATEHQNDKSVPIGKLVI